jgi:hypothetical protein
MADVSTNPSSEKPTIDLDTIARMYLGSFKISSGLTNIEFIKPESLPKADSEKILLSLKSKASLPLPFGAKTLDIRDVVLDLNLISDNKQKDKNTAALSGSFRIGINIIPISCDIISQKISLTGSIPKIGLSLLISELCGTEAMRSLKIPVMIHAMELSDLSMTFDPMSALISLRGKCAFGDAEIVIAPEGDRCDFLMGIKPGKSWKLSSVFKDINSIPFSDTSLIISSSNMTYPAKGKLSLNLIKSEKNSLTIIKGANLITSVNPADLNLDKILGLKNQLDVVAYLSERPNNFDFLLNLDGSFKIDKNLNMSEVSLRILPFRKDILCILNGIMEAKIGPQLLKFSGIMEVGTDRCTFKSSEEITWTEPFNIKNAQIGNLFLNLGTDYGKSPIRAEITGNLHAGNLNVPVAIALDSTTVGIIRANINRVEMIDLLSAFCDREREASLTKDLKQNELNAEFSNAEIVLSPEDIKQGEKSYKKGLQISGNMYLQGMNGDGKLEIAYADRMELNASLQEIKLADVFALKAAPDLPKLHISIEAKEQYVPKGEVTATISLLGVSKIVKMQMVDGLFQFNIDEKIFDSFQASLVGKAADFASPDRIYITADLKKDCFDYLQENTVRIVRKTADGMVSRIKDSEKAVATTEANLKRLSEEGSKLKEEKEKTREKQADDLDISTKDQMNAQSRVIEIKDKINSIDSRIERIRRRLDRKWRAIENAPWEDQLWRQIDYANDARNFMPRITESFKEIGDLEIANWNAFQDLEAAKLAMRSKRNLDSALPIESDPEIKANMILYEAESNSLKTAMAAAELIKKSLGPNHDVAMQVINSKPGELLKVTGAHFEGNLSAISGGKVNMKVDLQFAGNPPQAFQLNFDFNDAPESARSLAQMLLPASI